MLFVDLLNYYLTLLFYHFLAAALINWSLVSLADLLVFLFIQFNAHRIGNILSMLDLIILIVSFSYCVYSQLISVSLFLRNGRNFICEW